MAVSKYSRSARQPVTASPRAKMVGAAIYLALLVVLGKLFFWQILSGSQLTAAAQDQYQREWVDQGERGQIFTSDGQLLVGNATVYRLVAYPYLLERSAHELSQLLTPLLLEESEPYHQASESAQKETIAANLEIELEQKLSAADAEWVSLFNKISADKKTQIENLEITGLDFEPFTTRYYPEASVAAHLIGFVGHNNQGQPTGYFGVEGGLNKELAGKKRNSILNADALGFSLFGQDSSGIDSIRGRDVVLSLSRDLQFIAEMELKAGMERYGARAGEIVIMEPTTGRILALATQPTYDPAWFNQFEPELYKNPTIVDLFEPGSILKPLTVAIGLDTDSIEAETECPTCAVPRRIDKYTIRTWNDEYHPNITMTEALAKSDNTAMIYIAEQVGGEQLQTYLKKFGLGEELEIELHEDHTPPFPEKWGPVELATRSFGQGITASSLQMVRAIGVIANQGLMMRPTIIDQVISADGSVLEVQPQSVRQVISEKTAQEVTQMMVHAAQSGEAQWTYSDTHTVAAKTGTSQIPAESGGYKEDATIASFIGFAPPENPKFVMLVKLVEPQSSPWAAETAAPLWYRIAEKLFLSLNIPPDH